MLEKIMAKIKKYTVNHVPAKLIPVDGEEPKTFLSEMLSFSTLVLSVLVFIVPFKYFIMEPFIVEGASMSPNFETGHYIIINKLYDDFWDIKRGDNLVFVPPLERSDHWNKYTVFFDERKKYIKRVIALPGETIKLENRGIYIKKSGENTFTVLDEPYIKNDGTTRNKEWTLAEDEYFVLGDNRSNSHDSEEWGPILKSDIIGSPILRILPFSLFGHSPAEYRFEEDEEK